MRIFIPKTFPLKDLRVAITPDIAKKFIAFGAEILVERDISSCGLFSDAAFENAGAKLYNDGDSFDASLFVGAPSKHQCAMLPDGVTIIGMIGGARARPFLDFYNKKNITAFSLELMPRISRAQNVDVLSSQDNLYGYMAAVKSAAMLPRMFPMMMTSAGIISPAKVLILGAGVAGLQAAATAKRLGAVVSAFDVRLSAKEQVESVGAKFISVDDNKSGELSSGYAGQMDEEYKKKQRDMIADAMSKSDIVICSALSQGKSPPVLIDAEMVHLMRPGSVIFDIAADYPEFDFIENDFSYGGNCTLSQKGEIIELNGVRIVAPSYGLSDLFIDASSLYARNLYNFVELLFDGDRMRDLSEDDLLRATCIANAGRTDNEHI